MNALRAIRLAATFLLLWPGIAAAQQPASEPIKIGWIGHLTGVLSAYGQDMLRAAEMAVEDINANGGVLGRKLQLVVRDDRGDPSQAVTLVRELDTQERVLVVSGSMSADVSKALRGYAESNQAPLHLGQFRRRLVDRAGNEVDAARATACRCSRSGDGQVCAVPQARREIGNNPS